MSETNSKAVYEAVTFETLKERAAMHDYREHEPTGPRLGVSCNNCTTAATDKATARPWAVAKTGEVIALTEPAPANDTHFWVVCWHGSDVHQIKPADAELIVRAVNSHDALYEALQAAMSYIRNDHGRNPRDVRAEAEALATAALATATDKG